VKVVSLLPSATEIVYALGAQDQLCGVSCDCNYPAEVASKPVVSSKLLPIDSATTPATIDQLVRDQLSQSDSIYDLDEQLIRSLRPDLILAQDLCRVCAVPSGDVEAALDVIGCTAQVLSLDPHTLQEVLTGIVLVGRALGIAERAEGFVDALRSRLDRVRSATRHVTPKRVLALEWPDPPFNGGHWIPEMVEIAGGFDPLGAKRLPSRTLTWTEIAATAPEVIVFMPCGYDLDGAVSLSEDLYEIEEFALTPAALGGEVYATDSSAYFSRSGPRLVDGVEILAGVLHPEEFPAPSASRAKRV
jgi:iron complex transport system substrate-binding protein